MDQSVSSAIEERPGPISHVSRACASSAIASRSSDDDDASLRTSCKALFCWAFMCSDICATCCIAAIHGAEAQILMCRFVPAPECWPGEGPHVLSKYAYRCVCPFERQIAGQARVNKCIDQVLSFWTSFRICVSDRLRSKDFTCPKALVRTLTGSLMRLAGRDSSDVVATARLL